ncbi:hypothetical protein BD779DRAFT_1734187 [Infundibulicybe gibba]|nr:hypothetical protein BD779DRAFT_1734187 [Infundibulicybe gibba]
MFNIQLGSSSAEYSTHTNIFPHLVLKFRAEKRSLTILFSITDPERILFDQNPSLRAPADSSTSRKWLFTRRGPCNRTGLCGCSMVPVFDIQCLATTVLSGRIGPQDQFEKHDTEVQSLLGTFQAHYLVDNPEMHGQRTAADAESERRTGFQRMWSNAWAIWSWRNGQVDCRRVAIGRQNGGGHQAVAPLHPARGDLRTVLDTIEDERVDGRLCSVDGSTECAGRGYWRADVGS